MSKRTAILILGLALSAVARAQDPCAGYAWNVAHERALFGGAVAAREAGATLSAAPELSVDRLYELTLRPQAAVHFATPPQGKKHPDKDAYAGIAKVYIAKAGLYRVSVSEAFWVDLVHGEQVIASKEFAGVHACHAPRKILLYQLPSGEVLLQLSGVADARPRVLITPAPP